MKNPQRDAKRVADRIHGMLKPGLAVIEGAVTLGKNAVPATVIGFRTDSASHAVMSRIIKVSQGDSAAAFGYSGVVLTGKLASAVKARPGDTLRLAWTGRYDPQGGPVDLVVTAIADSVVGISGNVALVNERDFYHAYYAPLPALLSASHLKTLPDSTHPLWAALAPEYILMKRCATTDEYAKMTEEMARGKFKGIMVSIGSMYETASAILQLESALNLITLIACLILFFIILIGVVNTLRMTIRERTREIGTVRAIGMQKSQVLQMFLVETLLLGLFSAVAGTVGAFAAMWGLSSLTFNISDNPMGILLVKGHLFFAPTAPATIFYIIFIMALATATAYFPARRASRLTAANAMRHYE